VSGSENGRIKLSQGEARLYRDHLATLEGKPVQVTIGKVKGLRTEQQMRFYWGVVVKLIADHTGHDSDYIHEFLKDKFAPRQTRRVNGEVRIVAGCSHDLFKENFFADYVDHIRQWASAELGVVIPDPQQVQP
jgi:hypothetical protein